MKENLLIIVGPTGIGKTKVSIELAKAFNGEIISADSMQIYRHMDIGTAKVTEEEMQGIPHYLLDFVDPDKDFTVSNYKKETEKMIKDINKRDKLPIVVGGTGLYVNSLIYDLNFTKVVSDEKLRDRLEKMANQYGNAYLHKMLELVDDNSAKSIHKNDIKRVIRAFEIYKLTGKPMSVHNKDFRKPNNKYNLFMIGLNMDRQKLYEKINERVDIMISDGLINEVEELLEMGYHKDLVSMQGIGYKEIIMYLEGQVNIQEAIEMIKKASRNYAKRQLTWFRRNEKVNWFNIDEYTNFDSLIKDILLKSKENLT